jgi:hypothetical protein
LAKTYRTIKLTYNAATVEIDILLSRENVDRVDIETIKQTANGTRYHFVTGYKRRFTYQFSYSNSEVYDFFVNGFTEFRKGTKVTLSREADNGSFDTYDVIIQRPVYTDETIGATEKVYKDLSIELLEI